jgi:hypothetical protein
MNSLSEMVQFVNYPPMNYLKWFASIVIPVNTPISMRTVIQRLESLPPITLDGSVDPTNGSPPLDSSIHVKTAGTSAILDAGFFVLDDLNNVLWKYIWPKPDVPYNVPPPSDVPTNYVFAGTGVYTVQLFCTGVTGTGNTGLSKFITVQVQSPPPPPPVSPHIDVATSGAQNAMTYTITGYGFTPNLPATQMGVAIEPKDDVAPQNDVVKNGLPYVYTGSDSGGNISWKSPTFDSVKGLVANFAGQRILGFHAIDPKNGTSNYKYVVHTAWGVVVQDSL